MEQFLSEIVSGAYESQDPLVCAQQCLTYFVQENCTGPAVQVPEGVELPHSDLSTDGEFVVPLTNLPHLLQVAKQLLRNLQGKDALLWRTRAHVLHAKCLPEHVETLKNEILVGFDELCEDEEQDPQVLIEAAYAYLAYFDYKKARQALDRSREKLGVRYELVGRLGRRSKHQREDVPQLVLEVDSAGQTKVTETGPQATTAPTNVPLDEDFAYIHETPQIAEGSEESKTAPAGLSAIDAVYLLAEIKYTKVTTPAEDLRKEEIAAFLDKILEKSANWLVYSSGLLLRSKNQSESFKFRERSVLQIQALIDQYKDTEPDPQERGQYFFCLNYPLRYWLYKDLAEMYIGLGAAVSAYQIFKSLGMIEDAVECLLISGQRQKAERLANRQLNKSPRLLCLLGSITQDDSYFVQAWDQSNGRYTQAKRILGYNAFSRGAFQESIEHYKEALVINPLFHNAWFTYGCALMREGDWQEGATAFLRVTALEPESGDAWNNLAACYIRMEKNTEALHALEQALRLNRENWRMWENYLLLSVTMREGARVLMAMKILCNMQKFDLFTPKVFEAINVYGQAEGNYEKVRWVYDRVTNCTSVSGDIWTAFANFIEPVEPVSAVLDIRLKACRAEMKIGWDQENEKCEALLPFLESLHNTATRLEDPKEQAQVEMFMNNTIKKIERRLGTTISFVNVIENK